MQNLEKINTIQEYKLGKFKFPIELKFELSSNDCLAITTGNKGS